MTSKQRSVVIIVIILLSYISFGSFIEAKLLNISFINALYFSVVTIETIGKSNSHQKGVLSLFPLQAMGISTLIHRGRKCSPAFSLLAEL